MIVNKHGADLAIAMLQPDPGDVVIFSQVDQLSFEDIAVSLKLFPSRSQARKNGWSGLAPWGLHNRRCGKRVVWWFNGRQEKS